MSRKVFALAAAVLLLASIPGTVAASSWEGAIGRLGINAPRVYVGWMDVDRGGSLSWGNYRLAPVTDTDMALTYSLRGLWLGLSERITLSDELECNLEGWYLIPSEAGGWLAIELEGFGPWDRPWWTTRTHWYVLDGSLGYRLTGSTSILAGFRYDYSTIYFTNTVNQPLIPGNPNDEADIRVSAFLPYCGLETRLGGRNFNITSRIIGFPWMTATFKILEDSDNQTSYPGEFYAADSTVSSNRGYFLEAFLDCGSRVFRDVSLHLFVKAGLFRGYGKGSIEGIAGIGGINDVDSDSAQVTVGRKYLTVGANASFDFLLPLQF